MMKMNLQLFGGRSSKGGNNPDSKEEGREALRGLNPDDRNARELARVLRENRLSGADEIQSLKKGQSYDIQWGRNEVREGTYIGAQMVNGVAIQEFRGTNGRVMRIDNEDVKKKVRKRK